MQDRANELRRISQPVEKLVVRVAMDQNGIETPAEPAQTLPKHCNGEALEELRGGMEGFFNRLIPSRNCLIIPEEPRLRVPGEAPTRPQAPFRRLSCRLRQPPRMPKRFIRQFLYARL
jgi:hypothetical protein